MKQKGFTLIELVIVIVILGILAAVAIPKYVSLQTEARVAALQGLAGSVRSAVASIQGMYFAKGQTSPVTMQDGTTVAVSTSGASAGIPLSSAGGIGNAVNTGGTFTYTVDAAVGTYDFATAITNCNATYTAATGAVAVVTSGC